MPRVRPRLQIADGCRDRPRGWRVGRHARKRRGARTCHARCARALARYITPTTSLLVLICSHKPLISPCAAAMRAKARNGEAAGAFQALIRASLELEGGDGYLTRLWEVVDTSSPQFCSCWPEEELVEWLRPRLKLEFSETLGKTSHAAMLMRARIVGASMLEREARRESDRCRGQVAINATDSLTAASIASSSPTASPSVSFAGSTSTTLTPRSVAESK